MRTGLLSIREQYATAIFDGRKRYEFRRRAPRITKLTTFFVYVPGPRKELAGQVVVDSVLSHPPPKLWTLTHERGGIERDAFDDYFKGKKTAHALRIRSKRKFSKPIPLDTMRKIVPGGFYPPQYLLWLEEDACPRILAASG